MTRIGDRLSDRALQRLSWASLAFYVLSFASGLVAQLLDPRVGNKTPAPGDIAFVAMTALFPAVGLLIVRRQPRNTVGWLLHLTGVAWGLAGWSDAYSRLALHVVPSLPGGYLVEVLGSVTWWPAILSMSVYTVLFFPDGRLPSARWKLIPWVAGVDCLLGVLVLAFSPGKVTDVVEPLAQNPFALPLPHAVFVVLVVVLYPLLPLSLLASAASLLVRFRGSAGVQRLQLKWLLYSMAAVAVSYAVSTSISVTSWADARSPAWINVIQTVAIMSFGLIPVSIGIAVTRHGLYGIDRLISRTLLVGLLGVFVTGVYIGIVVGLGAIVGQRHPSVWLSVVATATVAVLFQPAREAVRRAVNRLVYGARATPYEVLSDFASRMAGRYTTAELLPQIARTLSECLGGAEVAMWLTDGRQLTREARWPRHDDDPGPQRVPVVVPDDLPPLPAGWTVPVRHRGELLGAISVTRSAAEPLSPAEQRLVEHVASQTGLVLRNVRLVDDLQASRTRLVSSSDEERRRLERNLHDGAQQ
ncbi:MAG: hypothetical protein QOF53_2221, partial [Nocardioidaceae bacterium]|nr:hypothetical protein [Nocardioidaceae bacterium]